MLGHNGAAADVYCGGSDLVDIQKVEGDAGSYDIGDGIGRANFVEVDLFYGNSVDARFGFCEALEHRRRILFCPRRDGGAVDHRENVVEMTMLLRLRAEIYFEFRCRDAAAPGFLNLEFGACSEGFQRIDYCR